MEPVDRLPDDLVRGVPDDLPDAAVEAAARLVLLEVIPGRDLPVDAVLGIRARVDEYLPARVPFGIEVEAAFAFPPLQRGLDVTDQEPVVEGPAVQRHPDFLAQFIRTCPAGGDGIVAGESGPGPVVGDGGDRDTESSWEMPSTVRSQTTRMLGCLAICSSSSCSDAGLGDIDECGERGIGRFEIGVAEQFPRAIEGAGTAPGQAFTGDVGAGTDVLPNVQDVAVLGDGLGSDGVALVGRRAG